MVLNCQHHQVLAIRYWIFVKLSYGPIICRSGINGFPFPFGLGNTIIWTSIQVIGGIVDEPSITAIGKACHWSTVKEQRGWCRWHFFKGEGVLSWLFIILGYIFQVQSTPRNTSRVVFKIGFIMGNFPASAWVTGIGRIVFQLCRIHIDLHWSTRNKELTCTHGTELVLLINVLGYIVDPSRPTSGIPIDKGSLIVVLGNKPFKLCLIGIGSPTDVMDILVDGTHQDFGKIGVHIKIGNFNIIQVYVEPQCTVPPLWLTQYIFKGTQLQFFYIDILEIGTRLFVYVKTITSFRESCIGNVERFNPIRTGTSTPSFSWDFDIVTTHFNLKFNALPIIIGGKHIGTVTIPAIGCCTRITAIGVQGQNGFNPVFNFYDGLGRVTVCSIAAHISTCCMVVNDIGIKVLVVHFSKDKAYFTMYIRCTY